MPAAARRHTYSGTRMEKGETCLGSLRQQRAAQVEAQGATAVHQAMGKSREQPTGGVGRPVNVEASLLFVAVTERKYLPWSPVLRGRSRVVAPPRRASKRVRVSPS